LQLLSYPDYILQNVTGQTVYAVVQSQSDL